MECGRDYGLVRLIKLISQLIDSYCMKYLTFHCFTQWKVKVGFMLGNLAGVIFSTKNTDILCIWSGICCLEPVCVGGGELTV